MHKVIRAFGICAFKVQRGSVRVAIIHVKQRITRQKVTQITG
jgi:hypothetical protein